MQVEVTAANIVKFGLVQLTGNSVETMLKLAQEAADTGHVLTVDIPDDQLVHMNIFDTADGDVVDERELAYQDSLQNPVMGVDTERNVIHDGAGHVIQIVVEQVPDDPDGEISEGEIVEDDE